MRLFVAVLPPPRVLDELERFFRPFQDELPDLRWLRRDQQHITLTFLGEVDDRAYRRLLPRLERAVARHPRLTLSLAGAGAFPTTTHARVLWAGVYGDRRALVRLAASTTAAGRREGMVPDRHPTFRPHLTLARCRRPLDVRPLLEPLTAFAGASWTAESVHLMRSHLPGKGRTTVEYESLESWSLR